MQDRVAIILVRPQMGENIGAAARAMANFGLTDLRIVNPRDGWPNTRADDTASGAFDNVVVPRVFDTLQDALADLHKSYATTARARDMVKPVFTPDAAVEDSLTLRDAKVGYVFGPERTGLENDELSLCNAIINVPTNPEFSSLNLGQCVLLIAAAVGRVSIAAGSVMLPMGDSAPVSQGKLDEFLVRLENGLEDADFFKAENLKPTMVRNIRNMFVRGNLSDQEVRTLHGILTALINCEPSSS